MKLFLFLFAVLNVLISAQNLSGKKLGLDPGHGFVPGQAYLCNDAETKRWESVLNHYVVPHLKYYLQGAGAQIITTRADFDSTGPCITLTQRKAIANNNNVHFFHSVHHNAFQGNANYTLTLFKQLNNQNCPTGNPAWPGQADAMALIQAQKIYEALPTTSGIHRGDMCFLGFNLGVLSTLNMPGTLSEASFFDFPAEILRLRNNDYLRTEAEALYHSFLQYYNAGFPSHGSLVGFVQNTTFNQLAKNVTVTVVETGDFYTVDNIGNGFYRIDSLQPGNYILKVTGPQDSSFAAVTIAGGKINRKNLTITETQIVSNVKLNAVLAAGNALNILWVPPSGTPDSVMLYLSEDGTQWDTIPYRTLAGNATGHILTGLEENKSYYIRLKAKNSISVSTNYSKAYAAFTSFNPDKILIVDGFNTFHDSIASTVRNIIRNYAAPLSEMNVRFETVSNSMISSATQLSSYKYIIWFTGNQRITLSFNEQQILRTFLNNGGFLFINGSDIAYHLHNGSTLDKEFLNQYLFTEFVTDQPDSNVNYVFGLNGFSNVDFTFGEVYPVPSPDVILQGHTDLLRYNENQTAAIFISPVTDAINRKMIFSAVPVESIESDSLRKLLLQRAHDFLSSPLSVDEDAQLPEQFSIAAYPNPFNPSTNIIVNVKAKGDYKIDMFNILGERIFNLFDGYLVQGENKFEVNMNNNPSGIYLIKVSNGAEVRTSKIMLMK
jgi:N-acetylmuramoyl-L-alanine amidase